MDGLTTTWKILIVTLAIWELIWKGLALWRSGRNNQPGWFVALLLINSAGILPILYLLAHRDEATSNSTENGGMTP